MDFQKLFADLLLEHRRARSMEEIFAKFHMKLGSKIPWVMNQFNQLNSLEDKFAFIWNLPEAQQCLTPPLHDTCHFKSDELAERTKTEGNISYKNNNLDDALEYYNSCIMFAPHPELNFEIYSKESCDEEDKNQGKSGSGSDMLGYKTLALGFANRSAVFLALKEYDKCLTDIGLALEYGYPEILRSKLIERKERCLHAKSLLVTSASKTGPEDISRNAKEPPVLKEQSATVPAFSDALEVAYSTAKGMHVVAARDIRPGDLVAVEKSFCTFLDFDARRLYCSMCFKMCNNPLPCPKCLDAGFCSIACRAEALQGKHANDCKLNALTIPLGIAEETFPGMAMKMLNQMPFAELKEKFSMLQKEAKEMAPEKLGFDENGVYRSDYRTVYHIAANGLTQTKEDLYKKCLVAVVLTKMVYEQSYNIRKNLSFPLSPTMQDFLVTGTVLMYHMCHFFFFDLLERKFSDPKSIILASPYSQSSSDVAGPRMVLASTAVCANKGQGMFPSIMLMNHSCNPTTTTYCIGDVLIVRAGSFIPAGKEVTVSYGPYFIGKPKFLRKERLNRNGMDCSCEACEGNWPTFLNLPSKFTFKCVKCCKPLSIHRGNPTCFTCDINFRKFDYGGNKKTMVEKFTSIVHDMMRAEGKLMSVVPTVHATKYVTKENFDHACEFMILVEKYIQLPCKTFYEAQGIVEFYFRQ